MNKHQIATILENGKYVGLVTRGEEIVFKTTPQDTPNQASALMTEFIQNNSAPTTVLASQPLPGVSTQPPPGTVASQPAPRKCCGRG
jgi:hypothetical protein